jgi:predicted amidohydrolase
MDPETGLDAVRNVGIRDGKIVRISAEALSGRRVIDAAGWWSLLASLTCTSTARIWRASGSRRSTV